ncbi:hypothetical protein SSX86_007144 [Deinandra increscens subsp. villosa]|uniref:GRF-type domain-containing protein n=1 Tax=Deinandra increscens subsp. villosa TaxID=3103831 RepID=A0AAP0DG76_9ASTR
MVFCWCGDEAIIRTSWTTRNPGRRFYGCPRTASTCRFIGWYDPQMCQRSTEIIPGLLRARNELEEKIKDLEAERIWMRKLLKITWICFFL